MGGRGRSPRHGGAGALLAGAALAIAPLGLSACGAGSSHPAPGHPSSAHAGARGAPPTAEGAFSWLRPAPPPGGWRAARISSGLATLSYPSGWKRTYADAGSVSAALRGRSGFFRGYLNATPQQGAEQLAGWAGFRIARNREEGSANLRVLASAENLSMRGGRGSCVLDDYTTRVGSNRYRELACIVRGPRAAVVFIGAAQPREWSVLGPQIERALSSFQVR